MRELEILPCRPPETPEEQQQLGTEPEGHPGSPQKAKQDQPQEDSQEASDTGKRRELNYTPESTEAAGPQSPENPQPSFIKCLLEAEEADPQQKAPKAKAQTWKVRAPRVRKSPKTPMPVQSSIPVNSSALSLSLTLSQTISAHVGTPLWAPLPVPAPKSSLAPASVPRSALHAPTRDLGWRRSVLLCQSKKWSLSYTMSRQESHKGCLFSPYPDWDEPPHEHLTLKQEEAFRTYFKIFNGPGEVDAHSLQNTVRIMGFSLTPAQVRDALMSADVDGNGHVDFKDFLAVMTDTKRFFCSMKQNTLLLATASPNPYTLFFEILSLLVEMLALPEMALEEITNYYKKKLNNGTRRAQEMAPAMGQQWSQKQLPYNCQQAYHLNIPEQRVHRIPSRLRHRNYATSLSANMHNSYAQVPCIPMCPRTDRMVACRKPVSYMLHPWTRTSWSPTHSLLYQPGLQGSREHNSNNRKRFSSTPSRTY
ncbi:spermatogenesis-associated protein 21 [Ctenodactylus gundi]